MQHPTAVRACTVQVHLIAHGGRGAAARASTDPLRSTRAGGRRVPVVEDGAERFRPDGVGQSEVDAID